MKRQVLIDTDTASDDAVALIMALRSPSIEVLGITVVAGNAGVDQATSNALYTRELCESQVPVYKGARGPLRRQLMTADWFHGADGLGDHGFRPKDQSAAYGDASGAIIQAAAENPGLEIITLGPLTNLALALRQDPRLAHNVSRCVVMGGAPCCEGNVTPAAEFNIWVDPDAAREVFLSGLAIEMVGWHLCRGEAALSEGDITRIRGFNTRIASFAIDCNSVAMRAYLTQTGEIGISLPDPVAMSILLDPSICTSSSRHLVEVETESELTRGMTVVDRLNVAADHRNRAVWGEALKNRSCSICWTIDVARWKALLFESLK